MNKKILATAMMAIFMTAGSAAFADNDNHRNDRGGNSHSQRDRGHGHDNDRHDNRGNKHSSHHDNGRHNGRGAGPHHNYYKGGYVSREYRQRQYVVNDWHGRHLHAPPRGYQWVQTGPDYVLIAISTGLIAQIVLSN
jgi:Ni/Co efflux regulator RcnB